MTRREANWLLAREFGTALGVMLVWASGMGFARWNALLPTAPIWMTSLLGLVGVILCVSSHVWGITERR